MSPVCGIFFEEKLRKTGFFVKQNYKYDISYAVRPGSIITLKLGETTKYPTLNYFATLFIFLLPLY